VIDTYGKEAVDRMSIVSRLSACYLGASMGGVFVLIEPADLPRRDGHKGVAGEVLPVETKKQSH
jgi:hypothetical protein